MTITYESENWERLRKLAIEKLQKAEFMEDGETDIDRIEINVHYNSDVVPMKNNFHGIKLHGYTMEIIIVGDDLCELPL